MRYLDRPALHSWLARALTGLTLSFTSLVQAAPPSPGEASMQPPPEALQACKSLGMGAACEVSTPGGKIKGQCWAPEGKPLACRPKDAPAKSPKGQR